VSVEPIAPYLEPLRKSVTVARPPAEAFRIFTEKIAAWWPLAAYSVSEARAASCCIEPRVGGLIYETRDDGERFPWGHVLVWEPPRRFVMSWHPGADPDTAQEVEIRFEPDGAGTRVELEHRGWQKAGAAARELRDVYEGGWSNVLGTHYVEAMR
jgi:uncharacterized protein YndB with AHSA1/START domain